MERKIALITGATSGIGEACARKFAEGGYDLILTGRNVDKMKAVERQARERGADVLPLMFDVRDRKAATAAVAPPMTPVNVRTALTSAGFSRTNCAIPSRMSVPAP